MSSSTEAAARVKVPRTASDDLRARAHELIPAGCHTYSKGDDQFPANAPAFIVRGSGCRVWDPDGREFLDWGMGLRSVILGHAYPRVLDAVQEQLARGSNFTRPSPVELELAETLVDLVPAAEMVKFAKNGSDVTTAGVRLARAYTGRDMVAVCADQPFFSVDDWFIGTTPMRSGVPRAISDLSVPFRYNDLASLERLFDEHPHDIACVVMEPATIEAPRPGYLEAVHDLARAHGAVLMFDEMITGFRWHLRGAQAFYGVTPDLATFGKALANGFSVAALVGRREIMDLGGLRHSAERVFLLSTTHGGETHSLVAARETIAEMRERDVVDHVWRMGERLQQGIRRAAGEASISSFVDCVGYPCSPAVVCRDERGDASPDHRTLFLQEMAARGILIPYIAISYAHREADVDRTLDASREAFETYRRALEDGSVARRLIGPAVKPVFRTFN